MHLKIKHSSFANIAMISLVSLVLASCSDPRVDGLTLGEERSTSNEAEITEKMISAIKETSLVRHQGEQIKRFNQSKTLGCVDATFTIENDLSKELAQGIFVPGMSYPASIRYANATKYDDREKDFRGMSISVQGVSGESLWGEQGRQDFLLNSYPVLFTRDGSDFLEFIEATRDDKAWIYFVRPSHLYSLKTAFWGREKISNPFSIRYWSTVPFRHGMDSSVAVKYSVQACEDESLIEGNADSENFLTQTMSDQLYQGEVCLDFMVQFQADAQEMPIEDASKRWNESDSPFLKVAEITIEKQPFSSAVNQSTCEAKTFNPWQSLAEHQPLGDLNRLRKAIYSELGEFRAVENSRRN